MKQQKRKKRSFGKVVKRLFKKMIKGIVNFFINIKNKFMSLPSKIRYVIYVWLGVLIVILVLIIGSNTTNKKMEEYKSFEQALSEATLSFVKEKNITPTVGKKLKVDLNMLEDLKYLNESSITDNTCIGYSIVYYDEEAKDYVVDSYINCKHYTTKDYALDAEQ